MPPPRRLPPAPGADRLAAPIERARLTKTLATMHEAKGEVEEARKAWKAEAAEDELRAKEDQALEGLTLHTSSKSETA